MLETIRVNTSDYEERVKKKPQGYGLWNFKAEHEDWYYGGLGEYLPQLAKARQVYADQFGTRYGLLRLI